jgi:hypothetical protein
MYDHHYASRGRVRRGDAAGCAAIAARSGYRSTTETADLKLVLV